MAIYNKKAFVIATLRKASYRHPARTQALQAARVERNQYKCAMCGMIFPRKQVQLDHKNPIIDPAVGFVSWDSYIERLFCEVDGYQVLDLTCHKIKTDEERAVKKATRGYAKKK